MTGRTCPKRVALVVDAEDVGVGAVVVAGVGAGTGAPFTR